MKGPCRFRVVLTILAIIICLSVLTASLPIAAAKEVVIEVDIDVLGGFELQPNPTPVAEGDTVRWHIRTGTPSRGFRVILPKGKDSPFGNEYLDKESGVAPAVHCHSIPPDPGFPAIHWPHGVSSYRYTAETYLPPAHTSQSPSTTYTDCILVKSSVGGIAVQVDKLGLVAPNICLTSTILVATVVTAIYAKRVKRREQKS